MHVGAPSSRKMDSRCRAEAQAFSQFELNNRVLVLPEERIAAGLRQGDVLAESLGKDGGKETLDDTSDDFSSQLFLGLLDSYTSESVSRTTNSKEDRSSESARLRPISPSPDEISRGTPRGTPRGAPKGALVSHNNSEILLTNKSQRSQNTQFTYAASPLLSSNPSIYIEDTQLAAQAIETQLELTLSPLYPSNSSPEETPICKKRRLTADTRPTRSDALVMNGEGTRDSTPVMHPLTREDVPGDISPLNLDQVRSSSQKCGLDQVS